MPRPRRKLLWWVASALALVVLLAVGGPFVYIHFIEGPAPAKLSLPTTHPRSGRVGEAGTRSPSISVDGNWNVGSGSIVGYRVQEVLIGQQSTAVGRTTEVWGSLTILGSAVTKGSFTANMASVVSDQSQRNAQFDGRIMNVSMYPTARFTLTKPIELRTIPTFGAIKQFAAFGILAMHGVSRPVSFTVSAERLGKAIDLLAEIPIVFADWNISNPSVGGFVTTQSSGTLEVLLHLSQGKGNPVATSGPSAPRFGGGPVTVPSTTVPPLQIPSR